MKTSGFSPLVRSLLGSALIPASLAVTVMAHAAGHGPAAHSHSLLAPVLPLAGLNIDVPFVPAQGIGMALILGGTAAVYLYRRQSARRALARA